MLSRRIDIAGGQAIDMPMSVLGGLERAVIVDISRVELLASLGLRSLLMAAKAIARNPWTRGYYETVWAAAYQPMA